LQTCPHPAKIAPMPRENRNDQPRP
jgi:hypothetical protein